MNQTSRISKSSVTPSDPLPAPAAVTTEMTQVLPATYCLAADRRITSVVQSSRTCVALTWMFSA